MVKPLYTLEVDWDNDGAFTSANENITANLFEVECRRGRDYASQLTGRSTAGRLIATLRNREGIYSSLNSSSPLFGSILPGRLVRLRRNIDERAYWLSVNYVISVQSIIWTGYLQDIQPVGNVEGIPIVTLTANGPLGRLAKDITPEKQENETTGTIIDAILDEVDWPSGSKSIDAGQTTVSYWYEDNIQALDAIRDIEDTELGFLYESEDGKIIYEDRHHRLKDPHLTSQKTYSDASGNMSYITIEQEDPAREIYNDILATVEKYAVGLSSEVLWTLEETPVLAAGESVTYWAEYPNPIKDPNTGAFVDTWDTPAIGADITQTGVANGDVDIAVSKFAKTMKITITNNNAVNPATLTKVQAQGISVTKLSPVRVSSSDATSQGKYGIKTYKLPSKWLPTTNVAQDYTNHLVSKHKDPDSIVSISYIANKSAEAMTEAITRNISDRITLIATGTSTYLGINNDFFIEAITHKISNAGTLHVVTYELSDAEGDGGYWVLGTSALGTDTKLAY